MEHNIQAMSFLIGSFRELVNSFGQNNKTVAYFRSNVQGLINIGQINVNDALLVSKLIGMENTDNVKWEISNVKVNMYIQAVNNILQYGNPNKDVISAILINLKSRGEISDEVENLVRETFDIKGKRFNTPNKENPGFGSLEYKGNKDNSFTGLEDLGILKQHSNMSIRVRNSQAVCSCDPSFYTVKIADIFDKKAKVYPERLFEELIKGSEFSVGMEDIDTASCGHSIVYRKSNKVTEYFKDIDWKKVYEWYKVQTRNM